MSKKTKCVKNNILEKVVRGRYYKESLIFQIQNWLMMLCMF